MKTNEHGMLLLGQQQLTCSSKGVCGFFGWGVILGYGFETSRNIACGCIEKVWIGQLKLL